MGLRPQRLRSRLILWHVLMLSAVLAVYIGGVTLLTFWQMDAVLKRLAAEDLETVKGLLYIDSSGKVDIREGYHHRTEWKQFEQRMLEILSPDGAILYRNDLLNGRDIGGGLLPDEGVIGYSGRTDKLSDGTRVAVVSKLYTLDGKPVIIRVAYDHALLWNRLKETVGILLLALPLALTAAAFAAYKLVSKALDPIEKMAVRIEQINSERLNERLPVENSQDELGHLARVCNGMLERIQESFEQLRRFTADASHELRTPLAAMRSMGEVALDRSQTTEDYKEIVGSMLEEVNRLTGMVEGLLTLSRAEAGQFLMHPSVLSLRELVEETHELLEVLMDEKRVQFQLQGGEDLWVKADRTHLRQALINLMHNAVKFTPAGGQIKVLIEKLNDAQVRLSVADTGPGIPADHASKVFERFYRVDASRGGDNKGAGLGLSIAKWAVEANDGEIGLESNTSGGATFWMKLPSSACSSSS